MNDRARLVINEKMAVDDGDYPLLERLKKIIEDIAKQPTVRNFYVGIGSGATKTDALKRRYDAHKQRNGINEIILLCTRPTQVECRELEKYLTDHVNRLLV